MRILRMGGPQALASKLLERKTLHGKMLRSTACKCSFQHTGTHAGRLLGRLVQHAICVNGALSAHGGDCNGRTRCGDPSHGCATERGSYCSYGTTDGRAEWREWCRPRPVLRKLRLHVGAGHQSPDVVAHGQATESASRRSESCGLGMFLLDSGEVGGLISTPVHQYDVASDE